MTPRPRNSRRVAGLPRRKNFKPAGIPVRTLDQINMTVDEYEAIRLADLEGLYHEEAAKRMKISRQTFGRILDSARHKMADTIINGKALLIEGGEIEMPDRRKFWCYDCKESWDEPFGTGRPRTCPECGSDNLKRIDSGGPDKGTKQRNHKCQSGQKAGSTKGE